MTNPTEKPTNLLDRFPAHSYADWKKAAEELLKGKPFDKLLITPTYEGFDLDPIYMAENTDQSLFSDTEFPGAGNRVRGSEVAGYIKGGWKVSQELSASEPKALNKIILNALANGQTEINLWFDSVTRAGVDPSEGNASLVGRCGVSVSSLEDMRDLFAGVHPEAVSWYLHGGAASLPLLGMFKAWLDEKEVSLDTVEISLDFDPVGHAVETGKRLDTATAKRLVRILKKRFKRSTALNPSGLPYHNAGAASYQELAFLIATGAEYLRTVADEELDLETVASSMKFTLGVGPYTFIEIAKFRAFRKLWNRVLTACEIENAPIRVHARTGLFNKTQSDPYVNMLRTTTEAFSAVVGGCESMHVGPFDEVIREPNEFSRRIARNTQTILAEECDMARVIDPAGGSWAVETLTERMAEQAWALFQEIEAKGGITKALESGYVPSLVEGVRQMRVANLGKRKDVLVGTNQYPNRNEKPLQEAEVDFAAIAKQRISAVAKQRDTVSNEELKQIAAESECPMCAIVEAYTQGATLGQVVSFISPLIDGTDGKIERLKQTRLASDYEKLRHAKEELTKEGINTDIFQLNLGPSRAYRLRADWTSSFFEVVGLNVLNEEDYLTIDDALSALSKSAAKTIILVSNDETYAAQAETVAKAIKEKFSDRTLLLAGAPGENETAWKRAGIDDFVHVRVNNYQFNKAILERLGATL